MYVVIDSGTSSPHATPRFFAFIQMTTDCSIVRNLSFSGLSLPIALVYLSANSHAVTKSTHLHQRSQVVVPSSHLLF